MTYLRQGWYLQVWQYLPPTSAERNIDDAIALALQYKAAGIWEKVLDGTWWMGFVNSPLPANMADVDDHRARCEAAGLHYVPWTNPLWGSREHLDYQAQLYAEVGNVCDIMVWDSEPYDRFWGANRPEGDAAFMMDRFRQHAPDVESVWQPDPRPGRLAELRPLEWSQHMNVYAPQSYWSDFQTDVAQEVNRAFDQARQMGIQQVCPTIPANTPADNYPIALNTMGSLGITSTVVWRMGTATASQLAWLAQLAPYDPGAQDPEPDPLTACYARLERYQAFAQVLIDRKNKKPWRNITRAQLEIYLSKLAG